MLLVCLTTLLLAACAATEPLVASAPSTTVQVVVSVPCLTLAEVPAVPTPSTAPPAGLTQKIAALLADLAAFENYAGQADVLLRACAKEPQ